VNGGLVNIAWILGAVFKGAFLGAWLFEFGAIVSFSLPYTATCRATRQRPLTS
jgi:hypothetical protein